MRSSRRAARASRRADTDADTPLPPDAPVLILGSGLSMVDAWLSLSARRHRGPVLIVSRHGLLPLEHKQVPPLKIDAADVPFGTNLSYFVDWFRDLVEATVAEGGDWRSVVDGLRPYNQRIWQNWTPATRRQFLEHARPLWNIHRHRLPPHLHALMRQAIAGGQLELVAGKLADLRRAADGIVVTFRRRGAAQAETVQVARAYDCGGVTLDVESSTNPAILSLLAQRRARPDQQHIGLDVTTDLRVVDAEGAPSGRIFARRAADPRQILRDRSDPRHPAAGRRPGRAAAGGLGPIDIDGDMSAMHRVPFSHNKGRRQPRQPSGQGRRLS